MGTGGVRRGAARWCVLGTLLAAVPVQAETPAMRAAAAIDRAADPVASAAAWRAALPGLAGQERGRALAELAAALVTGQLSGEALAPIAEAGPLLAKAPPIDRARLYSAQATALADLNRLDEADKAVDAALIEWRKATPRGSDEQAEAIMTRATIAFGRGDLATAKRIGAEAVAMLERVGGKPTAGRIGTITNMSTFHLQARELEDSERYARQAITLAAGALPEDHPVALVALNNWVAVLAAQNRREESVDILGKIARIREQKFGPDYPPLAITYNNLSRNLMFLNRSPQAEPYARRAAAIGAKTRAANDASLAAFRDNLADILDEQGKFDEGIAIRRQALADLGNANLSRAMRIRRSLAVTLVKQKQDDAALGEFEAVAAWLEKTAPPGSPDRIQVDGSRAALRARLGRAGAGELLRATATSIERDLFAGGDASRRFTNAETTLGNLMEAAWRLKDRATGFRIAQLMAWDDASRAVAAAATREGAGPAAALLRKRQDLSGERDRQSQAALRAFGKSEGDYRVATAELARIDGELAQTEAALTKALPAFAALARFAPRDEAAVAGELKPDQALVMPVALKDATITFAVRRDRADWAIAKGADPVAAVAAFRRPIDDPMAGKFDPAGAFALYRTLVPTSLDRTVSGAGTWLLAPVGSYSALPFAALVTAAPRAGAQPAWLIRKVALVTVPGVGALNRPDPAAGVSNRFVGIGAPALAGTASPKALRGFYRNGAPVRTALTALRPLPAAQRELEKMGGALPAYRATLLTGAAATEAAVKATDFRGTGVLAFATHGLIAGAVEPGSEPGLVLTVPTAPNPTDDGLLTASEIARLDLPVDWVVLSACDTAAGAAPGAPALSGLARAFLYAGARSLLVSHWAVRDDVAARLTVDTVRRTRVGDSRPQALRKAMLALIDDPRVPGGRDPAVWAPFILVQR